MIVTNLCLIFLSAGFVVGNIDKDGFIVLPEDITTKYEDRVVDIMEGSDCNCVIKKDNNLEEILDRKLSELENNIQERFEEYVYRKINALEKNIPEKIQENVNFKLDTLKVNIANLEDNIIRKFEDMLKKNKRDLEGYIEDKNNLLNVKTPDLPININCELNEMEKKVPDVLEGVTNCKSDVLKNIMCDVVEKFDSLNKTIPYNLEAILDTKLYALSNKIKINNNKLEENIYDKLDQLNSSIYGLENRINPKLYRTEMKIADLQNNITQKMMTRSEKEKICIKTQYMHCKQFSERDSGYHRIDSLPLDHTMLERNASGHLTYFKMHIALKVDRNGHSGITLSTVDHEDKYNTFMIAIVADKQVTYLKRPAPAYPILTIDTPNIVSSTEFRAFYIKIENGNLEFGKEGDTSPIISFDNVVFSSFNYMRFNSVWGSSPAKFLYDCPDCNI